MRERRMGRGNIWRHSGEYFPKLAILENIVMVIGRYCHG